MTDEPSTPTTEEVPPLPDPPEPPYPPELQSCIDLLRVVTNQTIPPGGDESQTMFTDAELAAICQQSSSFAEAAWLAWSALGAKYADPRRAIEWQIGNERVKYPDPEQLRKWAQEEADKWASLAGKNGSRWLSAEGPVVWGVTTWFDPDLLDGWNRTWVSWDLTRLGGTPDTIIHPNGRTWTWSRRSPMSSGPAPVPRP